MSDSFWSGIESTALSEIEQHLLECNYPKLERVIKRQYRAKHISTAMEHFFTAECEFASRILSYRLDQVDDGMEIPKFTASSLEHAVHGLEKAFKHASLEERPIILCSLGKCLVFQGKYQNALDVALEGPNGIKEADLIALFKIAPSDADREDAITSQPNPEPLYLINSIFGLQAAFSKAIALEMVGRSREALVLYAEVTDFCRRFQRPAVIKAPALLLFVGLSMYRYGMLCTLFAMDPRILNAAQQAETSMISELRSRLLYDAAISLRLYLVFSPRSFGRIRHDIVLTWYMDALEGRFRRCNYQKTFDLELAVLGKGDVFCPESLSEDIIACTMVLESLQPLTPASKAEAQRGGSSTRVCASLARLAIHGHWEGLVKLSHSLFTRYAADASTYGRLILALMAAGKDQEAIRAGEIYVSIGGKEPSVLLVFCQACLRYQSKSQLVIDTVAPLLPGISADMSNPLRLVLGLAYLRKVGLVETFDEQDALLEKSVEVLEEAVVADENDPAAHFYLAIAYLSARKLKAAESSIAVSLSLEPDQPIAWTTFALIKSALQDFETCLQTFNTFHDLYPFAPFLPMILVKVGVLGFLGLWDDAGKLVEVLISSQTMAAGPVADEELTVASAALDPDAAETSNANMDPAQFRKRFYHSTDRSSAFNAIPPAQRLDMTMTAYKKFFPVSASTIVAQKLVGKDLMPESFIPATDVLSLLGAQSLLTPTSDSVLLAKQLWCLLGEIYVAQNKLHLAELCAHEAFLQSELDSRVYALKGLIFEWQQRWSEALECYQLGMQMQECLECRLGCARCYLQLPSIPHHLQLAWHASQRALRVNPGSKRALTMVAEVGRSLTNLETVVEEMYERAIELESSEPILPASFILELLVVSLV